METRKISDYIPEVKDYYTINNKGEIYSINSGLMKTRDRAGTDYQIINLKVNQGGSKTFRVHRLVMMVFQPIDNPEDYEVNHKDGNKKNNQLSNLEWCTASENQKHAFANGLQKPRRGSRSNWAKLSEQDIQKIFTLREEGLTQREIGEYFNCSPSNIGYILRGKTWKV
jgi:hypothetical protein